MNMKKAIAIADMSEALTANLVPPSEHSVIPVDRKRPSRGSASKSVNRNYTPPRSMTEAEKVYYERNKHLNGFYKS